MRYALWAKIVRVFWSSSRRGRNSEALRVCSALTSASSVKSGNRVSFPAVGRAGQCTVSASLHPPYPAAPRFLRRLAAIWSGRLTTAASSKWTFPKLSAIASICASHRPTPIRATWKPCIASKKTSSSIWKISRVEGDFLAKVHTYRLYFNLARPNSHKESHSRCQITSNSACFHRSSWITTSRIRDVSFVNSWRRALPAKLGITDSGSAGNSALCDRSAGYVDLASSIPRSRLRHFAELIVSRRMRRETCEAAAGNGGSDLFRRPAGHRHC
jgi:hypothetical protein